MYIFKIRGGEKHSIAQQVKSKIQSIVLADVQYVVCAVITRVTELITYSGGRKREIKMQSK
jgi:hypothetical protein